ncbi:lipocalin-like domain-containing protein [Pseudomonas aeruginosa]|nr:lipocalin-like domain-containing protein [Pseudomonas aeruginosa]MDP5708005.1 lipocalin-like domain-containing protein [Pseudomonas aeruginosa]
MQSYVEIPGDGSQPFYPLGEHPMGIIMYTPDGYRSAQLMKSGCQNFAVNDFYEGTLEEYKAAGPTYIAYTGPFKVDEEQRTLTHSMFISLFPNWARKTQPRVISLEGDVLTLGTATPINSKGKAVNSKLVSHRAQPEQRLMLRFR